MATDGQRADETFRLRPLAQSVTIGLLRAREAVMARFRPVLNQHGVTEQQWRVVRVLAERRACDATELAAASCIHSSSLSRILRALEQAAILTARPSPSDSRRLVVQLTAKGRRLYRAIGLQSESVYREIERQIGRAELDTTLERIRRLTLVLEAWSPGVED